MAAFGELAEAGAVALSDDGTWLADGGLLRRAFEHAGLFGLPIVQHAEDRSLSEGAPMHEGAVSTRLGLAGQPALAEAAAVARDLLVAEQTGGRLHVAHLSTGAGAGAGAAGEGRRASRVTCEVTPHHLLLTDEEVATSGFSTRMKMNPPLREAADLEALVAGPLGRDDRRDRHRPRPAPRRREGRRLRRRSVRHRRPRDGGLARP